MLLLLALSLRQKPQRQRPARFTDEVQVTSVRLLDRLGRSGVGEGAWGTIQQRSSSSLFCEQFWHGAGMPLLEASKHSDDLIGALFFWTLHTVSTVHGL